MAEKQNDCEMNGEDFSQDVKTDEQQQNGDTQDDSQEQNQQNGTNENARDDDR